MTVHPFLVLLCEAVAYSAFEIIGGAAAAGVFKITHEARSLS